MARTIETIQAAVINDVITTYTALANDPNTSPVQKANLLAFVNNTSRRAIWRLWTYVQSSAIFVEEILMDNFKAENELLVSQAIPGTAAWIARKIFEFQYSATNPQVLKLVDLVPQYPVIDPSLRIITRVSVNTTISGQVRIKVAKQEPPIALAAAELSALQSYVNIIGIAGVAYACFSTPSDKIYIKADVFYQGQYSAVIATSVINAINLFLSQIPFNGIVQISDLEITIRNVTGVTDVLLSDVKVRDNATIFANGSFIVQNKQVVSRRWQTVAGYITQEDTVGFTFLDSLTFIAI